MENTSAHKVVKSARRALEVLEYFAPDRPDANASEIARELGYPISSTAELLWNLVDMGYLNYVAHTRRFIPSVKMPLLGAWVLPSIFRQGLLLSIMEEIGAQTGAKVVLGMREGVSIRYVHVFAGHNSVRGDLMRGQGKCMLHSAMGRLFLSRFGDAAGRRIVHRLNAEVEPHWRVAPVPFMDELQEIRENGYSMTVSRVTPQVGAVAMSLPVLEDGHELAIGISSSAEQLEDEGARYLGFLREAHDRLAADNSNDAQIRMAC